MIIRHIEEKAEKVLQDAACFSAPVDVSMCALSLKIKLNGVDLNDEVSGLFVIKDKMAHVGYNKSHHVHRQRFTIAHEIGHFLLHSRDTFLFVDKEEKILYRDRESSSGEYQKEREANAFAAALLMPKKLLLQHIFDFDNSKGESLQKYLSEKFNVSETAMTIRLTNLGLIDFGLF
jgi:Zn-dependent peptidase ImmA (M78 family)